MNNLRTAAHFGPLPAGRAGRGVLQRAEHGAGGVWAAVGHRRGHAEVALQTHQCGPVRGVSVFESILHPGPRQATRCTPRSVRDAAPPRRWPSPSPPRCWPCCGSHTCGWCCWAPRSPSWLAPPSRCSPPPATTWTPRSCSAGGGGTRGTAHGRGTSWT